MQDLAFTWAISGSDVLSPILTQTTRAASLRRMARWTTIIRETTCAHKHGCRWAYRKIAHEEVQTVTRGMQ